MSKVQKVLHCMHNGSSEGHSRRFCGKCGTNSIGLILKSDDLCVQCMQSVMSRRRGLELNEIVQRKR